MDWRDGRTAGIPLRTIGGFRRVQDVGKDCCVQVRTAEGGGHRRQVLGMTVGHMWEKTRWMARDGGGQPRATDNL